MGVGRDQQLAVRPRPVQVHRGALRAAAERGAVRLAPADDLFLALDRELLPVVQEHPDPPDDGVRTVRHPGGRRRVVGRHEDPLLEVALGRPGVVRAVDLAHQVACGHRPCRGARRAVEAVHLPPHPGRGAGFLLQGAQGVEGDEPVVRTDLYPEVAVGPLGVEVIGGEGGQRVQGGRPPVVQAGAGEEGASEAEGDGQGGRTGVQCHPRVMTRAALHHLTGHQPFRHRRPSAQQSGRLLTPRAGCQIEGDQVSTGLKRSRDPRLMFPVKHRLGRADRGQRRRLLLPRRGVGARATGRAEDEACRSGRSRAADQPSPGDDTGSVGT